MQGGDSDTNSRLEQRLKSGVGEPLNLPKVETQLTRIAGQGEVDRLGYEGFTQDGVPALRVTAHEKAYGPPFVDLAVNVDSSWRGPSRKILNAMAASPYLRKLRKLNLTNAGDEGNQPEMDRETARAIGMSPNFEVWTFKLKALRN